MHDPLEAGAMRLEGGPADRIDDGIHLVPLPQRVERGERHTDSVGSHVGLGDVETLIWGQIEYRVGWGLPLGFTKAPDPPGWGIMLDPVYIDPTTPLRPRTRGLRAYISLMGRVSHVAHMALAEGGRTVNGGDQPRLRPYPGRYVTLAGLHVAWLPFAVHVTHYRYFRQSHSGIAGSSDWINLSFEYRF